MLNDDYAGEDDRFANLLAACDEVLAAGQEPMPIGEADTPPDLAARLSRGVACLRLLRAAPPVGSNQESDDAPGDTADTALSQVPSPAVTPARLGRFQILRELGRGGFGVVFLAYDPRLRREVALKVPRADNLLTPDLRQRFHQEARAAAALDHPNIVQVYEADDVGPICYIASAYCPGPTLAAWMKDRTEPVPFVMAAALVATLAEAVDHAHGRGVLHRDLKPANILLSAGCVAPDAKSTTNRIQSALHPLNTEFQPRVTDFGLARMFSEERGTTRTGAVLGTPSYMAPEQADGKGKAIGPAADVYALGAILFEILTGRPPFRGETDLDTLALVRSADPVPPRRSRPAPPART